MKLIMENWKKFLKEEEQLGLPGMSPADEEQPPAAPESSGPSIKWSKHNQGPGTLRGDVYNAEDEQLIQQALGPDYYVVEYQYDASGQAGQEAQNRSRQYFDKYVSSRGKGPNGEIVVMSQTTREEGGNRVHYFKMAHERDEDGNMYASMVT